MFGDKMKILMTGHTSPMGKELYAHLVKEHEVIGVSRESGYDLTTVSYTHLRAHET